MVRLVPAGERAGVRGVAPAKDPKIPGSDRARDEAIQRRSLSGIATSLDVLERSYEFH